MSKFLSLDWFKSKIERTVENVISKKIDNLIEKIDEEQEFEKPYSTIKLTNNVLTVVLNDGSVLSKTEATTQDFKDVKNAESEDEVLVILSSAQGLEDKKRKEAEIAKNKALLKGLEVLKQIDDFEVINDSVYLKGVKRSIPQLLVEEFITIIGSVEDNTQETLNENEYYNSLKKFWMKCCLNPNARSAEDLYGFLQNHHFKIDRHGNFYAYRRVVSKNTQNKELVEFVSNTYTKVKAVWKKRAEDYFVYKTDSGFTFGKNTNSANSVEEIGNLKDLYLDLPNLQKDSYTSAHTGMEDYRVGEVISMPRNEGNDNNQVSCSRGFHAASKQYNYEGFGDTPILMIVNPMDVLAVPVGEWGKLRTCRWFFASVLGEDERFILDEDEFDVTDLGDIFEEKCLENMQEYVQNSFAEEVKRHTFTLSNISSIEVNNIVSTLEEMKDIISKRVVEHE